ncbi:hypothetical protein CBCST_06188 [Clostridium botulinum C str. Stockholm]|nr:hypothetical protein CBCST_06188 [Clostridium botulinum C str. Stockholm]
MKKPVFKTLSVLISILFVFLLLGCTKESLKVNKNSLIMYSLKNGKIKLNVKDLKENTSKKVTIKNKILNENSVITETSNVFDPWLINSPAENQNDVLFFPYEDGKIISLKNKGHTVIGTINNYIFLCKYENDSLKIIKLDKKR